MSSDLSGYPGYPGASMQPFLRRSFVYLVVCLLCNQAVRVGALARARKTVAKPAARGVGAAKPAAPPTPTAALDDEVTKHLRASQPLEPQPASRSRAHP